MSPLDPLFPHHFPAYEVGRTSEGITWLRVVVEAGDLSRG